MLETKLGSPLNIHFLCNREKKRIIRNMHTRPKCHTNICCDYFSSPKERMQFSKCNGYKTKHNSNKRLRRSSLTGSTKIMLRGPQWKCYREGGDWSSGFLQNTFFFWVPRKITSQKIVCLHGMACGKEGAKSQKMSMKVFQCNIFFCRSHIA